MGPKDDLLEFKTRKKIYNFILKYPGCHLRELSKKLQIHRNTIDYHVKFLEKRCLIEAKNEKGYCRYYSIKKNGIREKNFFNVFRQTVPRNIILFLLINQSSVFSPKEMKVAPSNWRDKNPKRILPYLQKHHTTLTYHLNKLEELDIVERIHINNEVKYRLKNPGEIWDFLIANQDSLFDDTVKFILNLQERLSWKDFIDSLFNDIFEIFPHPYHV